MAAFSSVPRPSTILAICLKVRPSEGSGRAPQRRIMRSNSSRGLPADDNIPGCRLGGTPDVLLYHKFGQIAVIWRCRSKFGNPTKVLLRRVYFTSKSTIQISLRTRVSLPGTEIALRDSLVHSH